MKLTIAGIGPGSEDGMTVAARRALEQAELIVGYDLYVDLVKQILPEKTYYSTPMRSEKDRVAYAVRQAAAGTETVLICSGDPGVYGMASLALDTVRQMEAEQAPEIVILPGVTAALSAAALAGSPFTCDFAVISLSDLMVPWSLIEQRLDAAARGDFAIALYNPGSRKRSRHLAEACRILSRYRSGSTVCAIVENIGRAEERCRLLTLEELAETAVGMTTTVLIGSSYTEVMDGRMVTPRGYADEYHHDADGSTAPLRDRRSILLFGGTAEGRQLAETALKEGFQVTVSVVSGYGEEVLEPLLDPDSGEIAGQERGGSPSPAAPVKNGVRREAGGSLRILRGKMPPGEILERLQSGEFGCVIDATHPYAAQITESVRRAAEQASVPYYRVRRDVPAAGRSSDILSFSTMEQIIDYLNTCEGRVFFSTGSAGAPQYARLKNAADRAVIRILPSEEAVSLCREAGFRGKNLLCMQGPFDQEMNEACFRFAGADYLVTKSSGEPGGFDAKIRAARALGMTILILEPPAQAEGITLEQMTERLKKWKKQ